MRRWRCAGLVLALAPLLAGCMSLDAYLAIGADESIDYRAEIRISRAHLREMGVNESLDWCQDNADVLFPRATSVEPTGTEETWGCRVSGTSTVADFGRTDRVTSDLMIVRGNGEYTFTWTSMLGVENAELIEHFELSVSFPGFVTAHTGSSTVWFNTVTWRDPADLFAPDGLMAKGRDQPPLVLVLVPVAGLLVGLGLVVWLGGVIVRRRQAGREKPADWPAPDPAARMPAVPDAAVPAPGDAERAWQPPPSPPQAWAPTPDDLAAGAAPLPDPQAWAPAADDLSGEPAARPDPPAPPADRDQPRNPAVSPWAPPG